MAKNKKRAPATVAAVLALLLPVNANAEPTETEELLRVAHARMGYEAQALGLERVHRAALADVRRWRSPTAARWAACWCFEGGASGVVLGPEYDPGCLWFAALGRRVGEVPAEVGACAEVFD
jgi:hypothetical protein